MRNYFGGFQYFELVPHIKVMHSIKVTNAYKTMTHGFEDDLNLAKTLKWAKQEVNTIYQSYECMGNHRTSFLR